MARTTGSAGRGARPVDHAAFGRRQTRTPGFAGTGILIAALRHDRRGAPWVTGGAMNREFFGLLGRNPAGTDPAQRRRRDTGQPRHPTAARSRRDPERHRRLVPVPAALLCRRGPHRDRLRQARGPAAQGRRSHLRRPLASCRKPLQHLRGRKALHLLQGRRIPARLGATRLGSRKGVDRTAAAKTCGMDRQTLRCGGSGNCPGDGFPAGRGDRYATDGLARLAGGKAPGRSRRPGTDRVADPAGPGRGRPRSGAGPDPTRDGVVRGPRSGAGRGRALAAAGP